MDENRSKMIIICSDAIGETAEAVAKAAIRQFSADQVKIVRYSHVATKVEIRRIIAEATLHQGFIAHTLVQPELRETMRDEALKAGIRAVDLIGPMLQAYMDTFQDAPKTKPGLLHELDEAYFRKIEAIEFAVKYDDGKDIRGIQQAQIVLLGVSRTSKTPLSIYLAHKGIKTANYPLVPEIKPPDHLGKNPNQLVIGLMMNPDHLLKVRTERLKNIGLPKNAKYATRQRVVEELEYARMIMNRIGCPIIDVTERAIEETASIILGFPIP